MPPSCGSAPAGERVAHACDSNAIALIRAPRRFVFGPDPRVPLELQKVDQRRVIAADLHEFGLREHVTRGLKQYYAARRPTIAPQSVYRRFFELERKLRPCGEVVRARLAEVPVPPTLAGSLSEGGVRYDLALHARNLFDALACNDLLQARGASLEFSGWDTHNRQTDEIEPNRVSLFECRGALAALHAALPPDAARNLTLVIGGEFGRQIKANGTNGSDYGRSTHRHHR
jgi:hypothetical protein